MGIVLSKIGSYLFKPPVISTIDIKHNCDLNGHYWKVINHSYELECKYCGDIYNPDSLLGIR